MRKLQNRSEGFTIIELLIVLAIAALIILVVLIAVPQLQRNQRNQARQAIAGRIVTEINNFAGNNNGILPIATANTGANNFGTLTTNGFVNRYLNGVDINDPSVGAAIIAVNGGTTYVNDMTAAALPGSTNYMTGRICNGETTQAGNNRNFIFQVRLEGGATYCLDNS